MTAIDELAETLFAAERACTAIDPPTKIISGLSIVDAYAVQLAGLQLRLADGATVVGHKLGLTSEAMQQMLGVDQPDFGYLTADMISSSGATLSASRFIQPRVEAEIAFRLRDSLRGTNLDIHSVLAATDAIAPAIEVIDSRVADWKISIADTIADNASSAHVFMGKWMSPDDIDLAALRAELVVVSSTGLEERAVGLGSAVLGHPATAVAWLARALHEYGGGGIDEGEIVMTGAMARALPVDSGSGVRATVESLGDVSGRFV